MKPKYLQYGTGLVVWKMNSTYFIITCINLFHIFFRVNYIKFHVLCRVFVAGHVLFNRQHTPSFIASAKNLIENAHVPCI